MGSAPPFPLLTFHSRENTAASELLHDIVGLELVANQVIIGLDATNKDWLRLLDAQPEVFLLMLEAISLRRVSSLELMTVRELPMSSEFLTRRCL